MQRSVAGWRRDATLLAADREVAVGPGYRVDVEFWRINGSSFQGVAQADLRQLTGHTGNDDIEIRALYAEIAIA